MATRDTSRDDVDGDSGPEDEIADDRRESTDVSLRLQELARQLGVKQAGLARLMGVSRPTFNPYFTGTRGAGMPMLRKFARASGRTISWFLGEDAARSVIGTADASGRVSMKSRWLLVREAGEDEPWFAWARTAGEHRFLERPAGAIHVYAEGRYEIVAVIVGVLGAPPGPLSA